MSSEKRFPRLDGIMFPRFPEFIEDAEAKVTSIKKFKCRDSDVLLCTYPKSGTHWFFEIISMLLNGNADYAKLSQGDAFLDLRTNEKIEQVPSPRVISTHMPYKYLPSSFIEGRNKIVHVVRNPKDATVSRYCHYKSSERYSTENLEGIPGEWDTFVSKIIDNSFNSYGGWCAYEIEFENTQSENQDNMITIYYEESKKNPRIWIQKLAAFLHIDCNESLINDIAERTQFSKHKAAINNSNREDDVKHDSVDGTNYMYRKGEIGDWKNWFTVSQNEKFDKMLKEKMSSSNIKMIYS